MSPGMIYMPLYMPMLSLVASLLIFARIRLKQQPSR